MMSLASIPVTKGVASLDYFDSVDSEALLYFRMS